LRLAKLKLAWSVPTGFTNFYLLVKICRYRRQFGALCDGALVPEVQHG
jgi:hypothetical protein